MFSFTPRAKTLHSLRRILMCLLCHALALTAGCTKSQSQGLASTGSRPREIVGGFAVPASDPIGSVTVLLNGSSSGCTATLLDAQFALTAGHCVVGNANIVLYFATTAASGGILIPDIASRTVTQTILHPGYTPFPALTNDIALVRYEGGMPSGYRAVALLKGTLSSASVTQAGYGTIGASGDGSGTLREEQTAITRADAQSYATFANGKTTCHGDSGGPDFVQGAPILVQLGVHSESDCISESINVDVRHYVDWIRSHVSDLQIYLQDNRLALFRPTEGKWYVNGVGSFPFGQQGDIPVPGNYGGDGKTQLAVFRPSNGMWYINGVGSFPFGQKGDIPVPGNYSGDGKTQLAVFRPSNGMWYINGVGETPHGQNGDLPVPADYTGAGKTQLAFFRPSTGLWSVYGDGDYFFGHEGDLPVPGDYTGSGKSQLAVFRPANGTWYIDGVGRFPFGQNGDLPVPGNYFPMP